MADVDEVAHHLQHAGARGPDRLGDAHQLGPLGGERRGFDPERFEPGLGAALIGVAAFELRLRLRDEVAAVASARLPRARSSPPYLIMPLW